MVQNECELFPGRDKKWGLSFLINTEDVPGGRSAGSVGWGGLNNTYFWLYPVKHVTGVLMTSVRPFADGRILALLGRFEKAAYATRTRSTER